eukprot:scaffold11640_cov52-Phaeocystis_antarctica.AAC.1
MHTCCGLRPAPGRLNRERVRLECSKRDDARWRQPSTRRPAIVTSHPPKYILQHFLSFLMLSMRTGPIAAYAERGDPIANQRGAVRAMHRRFSWDALN